MDLRIAILKYAFSEQSYQPVMLFSIPPKDVYNMLEPPTPSLSLSPVTTDNASYLTNSLLYKVPADSGKFLWYIANIAAVLLDAAANSSNLFNLAALGGVVETK